MGDIRTSLDVYSSDIAGRVMNITEEIPDEERQDLMNFIFKMLIEKGNPGVCEVLAWGIRAQYLLWRKTRDWDKFNKERVEISRQAIDTRGHVY